MKRRRFKHIYGPVSSWRLGVSLGVDLLPAEGKTCTFDCLYCQLGGRKKFFRKRRVFVPLRELIKELQSLPPLKTDYITFSGAGEPTLAANLEQAIRAIRKKRKGKIAVITNASLLERGEVKKALLPADLVLIKLDAASQELFLRINRPGGRINFSRVVKAIKEFRAAFKGRLALQIMFIRENRSYAREIARLACQIGADEIQINTPLRPSAAKALSKQELRKIKGYFIRACGGKAKVVSVYDRVRRKVKPISNSATIRRRGSA